MRAFYRFSRNKFARTLLFIVPVVLVLVHVIATPAQQTSDKTAPTPAQIEFFEKNIRPVLANNCYGCHSAQGKSSGRLRLDGRDAILAGGRSGPAVIPGNAEGSLLVQRLLLTDEDHRMPKGEGPLSAEVIANLKAWIQQGAYWPAEDKSATATKVSAAEAAKKVLTPEETAYFKDTVRPILVDHCYSCHSAAFKAAGGLRLDTREGFFTGGASGPAVVPGNVEGSLLLKRVLQSDEKRRMPRESPALSAEEIAILTKWVKDGAAWPDEIEALPPANPALLQKYADLKQHHWAFQPLTNPAVPTVAKKSWPASDLDRFVLAKLEEKKLSPVADADSVTLIRRATYDLTGLPPTPAEVEAFRKDHSPRAYARLVDRLLQSPQFGERWGRHWLDVARYGESSGPSRNVPYPHAWRYRDYVIDSVNKDIPFNRFITEQIAGDLLPAANPSERDRLNIATGFLALGPKDVNQRFKARFLMDNVDDQIDTVSRSTLGLTVTCARCHDHKFDPMPTTDYYSMAGIFTSTEDAAGVTSRMGGSSLDYYEPKLLAYLSTSAMAPTIPADQAEKMKAEAAAAKKVYEALLETPEGRAIEPDGRLVQTVLLRKYQHLNEQAVLTADVGTHGYGIHAEREGKVGDTWVRIRGVEERHGPKVPRGFLTAFTVPGAPQIDPQQSGRLQLAQWLTNPNNPLTPRVYANRVWQHLFGEGIVITVDNFGVMGDRPSNPALLDYLAQQLIRDGWSTKKLIREIVLSHTYRLGSETTAAYLEIDPANRLLWRHAPRRLESEELRDSVLASSGKLELTPPAGSSAASLPMIEIADDGRAAYSMRDAATKSVHRSVYLPLLRDITPPSLAAFDPVTQTLVTGQRDATTVPVQALFLLNSNFIREQSLFLADKLLAEKGQTQERLLSEAYQRVLCRPPSKEEEARDLKFLEKYEATFKNLPPSQSSVAQVVKKETSHMTLSGDDGIDHMEEPVVEAVQPKEAREAAWMGFVQSLYASAEFQFVR